MSLKETDKLGHIVTSFENLRALIIGDIMIDSYLWGNVDRISPEAPVPIVSVHRRESRLGGAANVALNVKALRAEPFLCTVIGNDIKGDEFMSLLEQQGMSHAGVVRSGKRVTTTKFRVIGNKIQMLRVDEEMTTEISREERDELISRFSRILKEKNIDVVLFQDYDKGVISKELINRCVVMASEMDIPVVVDPKRRNFLNYKNVSLFKPNLKELREGLQIEFNHRNNDELKKAVNLLREKLNTAIIMVTLSEDGVFINYRNQGRSITRVIPSHVRSVADVSGAGDTVISVAALCMALKTQPNLMAVISNLAGGLVCEEAGVVPVNREKLIRELSRIADTDII